MSLSPTIDEFWRIQASWASSRGLQVQAPTSSDVEAWSRGLREPVRRGPTSTWIRVSTDWMPVLSGLLRSAGVALARALSDEAGDLGLAVIRIWPVRTGRSRAALAIVVRPSGFRLVASLVSRAPYTTSLPAWRQVVAASSRVPQAVVARFGVLHG